MGVCRKAQAGRSYFRPSFDVKTLHVHLDESGNFDFTRNGTKHFVFAVAWTYDPLPLAHDLTALRFMLLKQGVDLHQFHAAEDRQAVRNRVVATMLGRQNWGFVALVIEKAKVNPTIRDPIGFYPQFAMMVLRFVLKGVVGRGTDQVLIFTDDLPVKQKKNAVKKAITGACRQALPPTLRFDTYHHPCASNKWIQVADYCCWAVFRKWESGDDRTYDQLRPRLFKPELNVTERGRTVYY